MSRRADLAAEVKRLYEADLGLTFQQIADRLSLSRSYTNELYDDPTGTKTKARKNGYRQPCPDCGTLMTGSGGPNHPPQHCADCAPKHQAVWTRETVITAFQSFHKRIGRTPSATDTVGKWPSVARKLTPERLAEIPTDHGLPSHGVVHDLFGSWMAAQQAAGLPTSPSGAPNHRTVRRDIQRRDTQILDAIRDGADTAHDIALIVRRDKMAVSNRLATLTKRGLVTRTRSWRWGHPYVYELAETPRS